MHIGMTTLLCLRNRSAAETRNRLRHNRGVNISERTARWRKKYIGINRCIPATESLSSHLVSRLLFARNRIIREEIESVLCFIHRISRREPRMLLLHVVISYILGWNFCNHTHKVGYGNRQRLNTDTALKEEGLLLILSSF